MGDLNWKFQLDFTILREFIQAAFQVKSIFPGKLP
jgi:hypothetical protein